MYGVAVRGIETLQPRQSPCGGVEQRLWLEMVLRGAFRARGGGVVAAPDVAVRTSIETTL